MSYWPELLIETYHLLLLEVSMLEHATESIKDVRASNSIYITAGKLKQQAAKIKKRMKSLGYYDCWEKDDDTEVVVP